ncbi:cupin domain-containing protein [Kordiimonas marina]|uniref:cupin domain-containing protein n=1 Tax=Kordiimonas marina TaxID=2872312 RepID=UPI001FF0E25E|nr:cupin domain-containing protein [Kordiimonas marina]MCJ9430271.1 cupin domain-containing protein [Kordiimonas marina]
MDLTEAQDVVARALTPFPYDRFFDDIVGKRPLALLKGGRTDRATIVGEDPATEILKAYEKYASTLTCHIHTPQTPPPAPRPVESPNGFLSLLREYHQHGYTVRIPEVTDLSPALSRLTRALEVILGNPAGVVIFWSEAGAKAPIHYDETDVIAIQLKGQKRWFISDETTRLPNTWKAMGRTEPPIGAYSTYDVAPGDLLYIPRGTVHTVESTSESIHLAIGFVPVTIREAIASALDYLSDLDRPLRAELGNRADSLATGQNGALILEQIRHGIVKLQQHCRSDNFIEQALNHRQARMMTDLPKIQTGTPPMAPITVNSLLRHNPLATASVSASQEIVDFRQPGERILVHPHVANAMHFMATTPSFRVAEIPGDFGDDIRLSLANRLLASRFLEVVQEKAMPVGVAS